MVPKWYSFIYFPKHDKVISFWSCFNDFNDDSEPYIKIGYFWWGYAYKNVHILTRTGFLQCHHGFSLSRNSNKGFYP